MTHFYKEEGKGNDFSGLTVWFAYHIIFDLKNQYLNVDVKHSSNSLDESGKGLNPWQSILLSRNRLMIFKWSIIESKSFIISAFGK